ncbi:MAG: helix-turn-helix domain-containing protein, partial [Alphaproteobacteria bacterium]|nr:helix-turn-helix domain-containing protein [Alphaproteobacteria bacterium]
GELAELLDVSQGRVSRYEKGEEHPTLSAALGLQIIFGPEPRRLFPRVYSAIEDAVMRRAAELDLRWGDRNDPVTRRKRQLFADMVARAGNGGGA